MTDFDLVIHGGTIVTHKSSSLVDLAVRDGRIAAIGNNLSGRENIDAGGLLVLPGGVDPHVHLQMPTPTTVTSDDWNSGTLAAACGGTTTVLDFVEPLEGQSLSAALAQRKQEAAGSAWIDYGLHMTINDVSPSTLSQIADMMAEGVTTFKVYTTYDGLKLGYTDLELVMQSIATFGGLCMVHAEDDAMLQAAVRKLIAENKTTPQCFPLSRPEEAEWEAIKRCIDIARDTGVKLYIVHVSTSQAVEIITEAKNDHVLLMAETCPQYLLLDRQRMLEGSALQAAGLVCSPPLRDSSEKTKLWAQIGGGRIHSIGSDHCSFRLHPQKAVGLEDFRKVPGGLPGIELRYPMMHTFGVAQQHISLQEWVALCSTQPAKIFGIYPQKGSLAVGSDADIVLFDPNRKMTIRREILHENVDYSPYEGLELDGYPVMTILKGQIIVKDGQVLTQEKSGEFLRCGLPNFL